MCRGMALKRELAPPQPIKGYGRGKLSGGFCGEAQATYGFWGNDMHTRTQNVSCFGALQVRAQAVRPHKVGAYAGMAITHHIWWPIQLSRFLPYYGMPPFNTLVC